MNQGTILGSQIGRWIVLAAFVALLGALLLTIRPVFAQVTPPAAPTGLAAEAVGTQKVEVSWMAPAGTIVGYKIDRSTDGGTTWVVASANTGNDNAYYSDTHSSLAGKSVVYRVAAINSVGRGVYSGNSTSETLPKAGVQPGVPRGLKATVSPTVAGTVSLSWDAPSSQGASAIDGYHVQWSANGEHTWADITDQPSGTATTATDAGVPAGTTRYYRVAAENGETPEMGPYSASANVTTRPSGVPVAPTGLAAAAVGTQKVEVSWMAPAGTIVGYKIDRSTDGGTTWVVASANTRNDNAYYSDTHSSLAGKSVVYRVAASNSVGMGVYSDNSASATLPRAGVQPGAPTGLAVTGTVQTTATLSWDAPSSSGASAIDGYNVQWSANGEHTWADITAQPSGAATTATDTVAAGTTRYYRVAAENGETPEMGPYSAVSGSTTSGVPVAPTDLAAAAVGTQKVEVSWMAPAGTIVGYRIDRSTDGGTTWVVASANTRNDNAYYSDTHSSLAGKSVVYRVAAINSVGRGVYSDNSTSATLPRAGVQPGAPTGLKATVSPTAAGTVSLSWIAPSQGASAIDGYHVQWSANGEHTWADITDQPSGTGTTATDAGVPAGTTRYYRVAAENGETPEMGPYSASANVTTRPSGVPVAPTGLAAAAVGTQKVEVSWMAPAGTIVGYKIDRSTDGGTTWVVASANTRNDNAYYSDTHSSLAGKSVVYRVAASNSVGMGVYSDNSASATLPRAGVQPGAPTGLTVTPTSFTTVTLSWDAPSSSGASAIDGYNVQWSANGEHTWADITAQPSGAATTATDTVAAGTTRYYRVAAENGATPDRGPYSAPATLGPADQMGTVTLSTQEPMVGMAITADLTDADGMVTGQMWQWQKSMDKSSWMAATGTGATARRYTPEAMDEYYYLRATVEYTDAVGAGRMAYSIATESMVTVPADRMGTVTLSTQEPMVGMAITADLTDADGMVTGQMWQWQKSMDKSSWMAATGTGATARRYTPAAMDEGYYLRATVTYTDAVGAARWPTAWQPAMPSWSR